MQNLLGQVNTSGFYPPDNEEPLRFKYVTDIKITAFQKKTQAMERVEKYEGRRSRQRELQKSKGEKMVPSPEAAETGMDRRDDFQKENPAHICLLNSRVNTQGSTFNISTQMSKGHLERHMYTHTLHTFSSQKNGNALVATAELKKLEVILFSATSQLTLTQKCSLR